MRANHHPDLVAGAAAGIVAGLAASWMMNRVQALAASSDSSGKKPTTVKAADRLSRAATGQPVPKSAQTLADFGVHYGLGALLGLIYGVASEFAPSVRRGAGVPFGLTVAAILDEGAVPALGITPPPWLFGLSTHAYSFGSHVVFGAMLEATRRFVRGRD